MTDLELAVLKDHIFSHEDSEFKELALSVFRYQAEKVPIYQRYVQTLGIDPNKVSELEQIPFLPISFFKTHKVLDRNQDSQTIFESSGTSGSEHSYHYVSDLDLYHNSVLRNFNQHFGVPEEYSILALLPSYLERKNASLIYMVRYLMDQATKYEHGFFLHQYEDLNSRLIQNLENKRKTILIGVTFALLDFAAKFQLPQSEELIVIETGGMKGRGPELVREELHKELQKALGVRRIGSEYGMTELLSQAWSFGEGIFRCPPWMRIKIRDPYDPFTYLGSGRPGGVNVIDLANIHSCSFIATDDIGRLNEDASFTIEGRLDQSDLRGCNLMVI